MPQHDPNDPSATGRPPFGGDAESVDDEDFWERARRTKKEDKKAGRWKRRDGDGGKATSSRKRKAPSRSGDTVSFALPPTGGAKGGTDYPVSERKARARRLAQGLPPDPEPTGQFPGPDRGGRRGRLGGRQPAGAIPPPDPQPIPMPPAARQPGPSRVPPAAPTPPVRPAAQPPLPQRGAPTAPPGPQGPVGPPTSPGTPPLMSPLLARSSRLAGRRAQRTGQTPVVPPAGSPGSPTSGGPGGAMPRSPLTAARGGRPTGETPLVTPPSVPSPSLSSPPPRGRSSRLPSSFTPGGPGSDGPGLGPGPGAPGPGTPGGPGDGRPPTLPGRPAPRRSVGAPPAARSGRPDLLASPPAGTRATGPLPSSRRRPDPLVSPSTGNPAWDAGSTTGSPPVGRAGRGGRAPGAGAPAAGAPGRGPRPGDNDPGATGQMPRATYPASGRPPTTGNGPMLNATQPTPATARGLRRPTTGSTPLVGPNTGGSVGPVSAELPVVEPGPVAGVTASPWETPPVPRNPASRPPEARGGPRSGEVPVLDDRFDNFVPRGTPPRGEQPVTTRVDLERDFERPPPSPLQEPPHRGRASAGPGPGPGTMTRRPSYDDRYDDEHDDYDDEYDDHDEHDDDFDGSERQGCGRLAVPLVVVAVVLCIALVTAAVWARRQINPGGAPGPTVSVDVVSGQSTSDIGDALEKADVITSASVWTWYVRLRGGGDVQAGTYEMHKNMSMGDALDELTSGPLPPDARKVTVAEGWTTRELVSKLTSGEGAVEGFTAEGVQQALVDPALRSQYLPAEQTNVEGTLFPETYNISEDATPAELVEKMVDQFDATVGELDLTGNAERLGYPPYEVLIIASLIEEEAKLPEERAQVARVIYNRLGQDIALGIDATTCYDLDQTPCRPTSAELNSDSPYNTRQAKGLPPTPISSPGRASIEAALHPAEGPWIYYVLKDAEGHHTFTDSTEEFNQAKQACHDANLGCG